MAKSPQEAKVKERRVVTGPIPRRYYFVPSSEAVNLAIASLAVSLAGLGLLRWPPLQSLTTVLLVIGFVASFLGHELAHKFTAVSKGLAARFKIFPAGLLVTLVTAVVPIPFKVIMPGAVEISGYSSARVFGKIALAGPLFNILAAALLTAAGNILGIWFLRMVALINSFLAFFNLLPIPPLDGEKVFMWSRTVWAAAFTAPLALVIVIQF